MLSPLGEAKKSEKRGKLIQRALILFEPTWSA